MPSLAGCVMTAFTGGWPVFPCRPNDPDCPGGDRCECKAPLTEHGFQDATTDAAQIRAWWARWPTANVAIATGAPGPDVFDVDVKAGNGMPAFTRVKRAGLLAGAMALVQTPSGGLHVYFKGTDQPCRSLSATHHVETKRRGGYVLTPPSVVHGKPYVLLDRRDETGRLDWEAVHRLLRPPRPPAPLPPRNGNGDVTQLAAWVAALTEGNRNAGLYWAAHRAIDAGTDPAELVAAAVQAGLSETEAHRTIDSARRARQ